MQQRQQLSFYIESRSMLVAGTLRRVFEQRGFIALPGGRPAPVTGFTLAISTAGPAACWLMPDLVEAVPDELGELLSSALQCRVTSIASVGSIQAYAVSSGGRILEKLAVDGTTVLDDFDSPHRAAVLAGGTIIECLEGTGLHAANRTYDDIASAKRTLKLSFAPKERSGVEAIEIDPTISCPVCDSAMRKNSGRYGVFWGCVRYPECRGRLSEKQAMAARQQ